MDKREQGALDIFGRFMMERLRDPALDYFEKIMLGAFNRSNGLEPSKRQLRHQEVMASLSVAQKEAIRQCVYDAIDGAIHDFLFQIEECGSFAKTANEDASHESYTGTILQDEWFVPNLQILVNDIPLAGVSDGMHGLLFGNDGWFERFSAFQLINIFEESESVRLLRELGDFEEARKVEARLRRQELRSRKGEYDG